MFDTENDYNAGVICMACGRFA